jgi:hypothetical protein
MEKGAFSMAIVKCWWGSTTRDIVCSNGIVGMLGCTRGACIKLVGCRGRLVGHRDDTGNVSRSGVWGKQVVRVGASEFMGVATC